jgi:hypothetical protein
MEYTYRAEIVANQSVQDVITELLEEKIENIEYTVIPGVMGKGRHSKKLGNTIWPELNFILFVYTDKEGADKITEIIKTVQNRYPKEGISLFLIPGFSER